MKNRKIYQKYLKRPMDICLSIIALIGLSPVLLVVSLLVRINLGSPILFRQERPGIKDKNGRETFFTLYKFRTMTNEQDCVGNPLPDKNRLTRFGKILRSTSLDELPELYNILKGDMSLIGPRPQLVIDLVFMNELQRKRHTVRPGLTGLAQINGRNCIIWEDKFTYDLKYVEEVTFLGDCKIFFKTIRQVLSCQGIHSEGMATSEDFGDYLLRCGKIGEETYHKLHEQVKEEMAGK